MRKFALCLTAWLCAANAHAKDATAFLDRPLRVVHVALPRDPANPQARPELRCSYYPGLMVKEIDLGEVGAAQLSMLGGEDRMCRRENVAGEKIVSPDDWTGYLMGVIRGYVIFRADDGWNDGMGFAVFTPDGRKLFDDVAKDWSMVSTIAAPGPPSMPQSHALALRYVRVYGAPCSLANAGAAQCWRKIAHDTGLRGPAPACGALYAAEQQRTPQAQVLDDPTVIDYDAAATIAMNGVHVTPVQQGALRCRPAE